MSFNLTTGATGQLINDPDSSGSFKPTMQFLTLKKVTPAEGRVHTQDRYRSVLSDGVTFVQAMLATQLNQLVEDGTIKQNSVIIVDSWAVNSVSNPKGQKSLVIVLGLTPVGDAPNKIGNPESHETHGGGAAPKAETSAANSAAPVQVAGPSRQQQQQQGTTRATNSRPGGEKAPPVYPIEGLSPYQNKWTIKARVTQKSDIKTWSNQKGDGKLFSVTLMDETGEIKATGFNAVVDELFDKLQEGRVYYISKARVTLSKKKFSQLANDYEINFEKYTEVEECTDQTDVPEVKYNFVEFSQLENVEKDATCDIIGVVKDSGQCTELISKASQKPVNKRELTLVDRSGYQVRLTLWGKQAEQWNVNKDHEPIIACKNVKVSDFNGRSLSVFSSSTMNVDPDIADAHTLRGWYDAHGLNTTFQSFTGMGGGGGGGGSTFKADEVRTLQDVKQSNIGTTEKAEYFSTRASIIHIKPENLAYPACQTPSCNKKVVESGDGWRCEKCSRSWPKPLWRYMLSMNVADHTEQAWLQGFNDAGVMVFGMTADELMEIKDRDDDEHKEVVRKAITKTYNFNCRAKQDTYNDQTRVRYGIQKILPLDYAEESRQLVNTICTYNIPRPSPSSASS